MKRNLFIVLSLALLLGVVLLTGCTGEKEPTKEYWFKYVFECSDETFESVQLVYIGKQDQQTFTSTEPHWEYSVGPVRFTPAWPQDYFSTQLRFTITSTDPLHEAKGNAYIYCRVGLEGDYELVATNGDGTPVSAGYVEYFAY